MANDDRGPRRPRDDEGPRPQRMGDRGQRPLDDPEADMARYGGAPATGYGAATGRMTEADPMFGAPGYDASFAGPRFDRVDVGSVGSHGVHPVSSPFGADYGGAAGFGPQVGYGSTARRAAELGTLRHRDPHYAEARRRELERLDRDYEAYHGERQETFEREFGAWRERRGKQREALGTVRERMEVVGSDGAHIGTVDHVRNDRIELARNDPNAGGVHHTIPCKWIDKVDDKVCLNLTAAEATRRWEAENRNQAVFGRDRGGDGPHILNRSFAGTYPEADD
jgi:hypothetical protein